MTLGFAQRNVFTKSLLTLYIDGKLITDQELLEPLNALKTIENIHDLIEEVYLLSMVHHLSPINGVDKLHAALETIEMSLNQLDEQLFKDVLAYKKYIFAKVLCGSKTFVRKEVKKFLKEENLSSLVELALLGSISLFVGILLNDSDEFEEGCQIAELISAFMKEDGEVDFLFLLDGGEYNKDAVRVSLFVLMSLYESVLKNRQSISKVHKLDPFEGGLFQTLDVENRLLCRVLETAITFTHLIEKREAKDSSLDGAILIGKEGFTYKTIKDTKVGIGSISYNEQLLIPSFGPHLLPLGKNEFYGLNPPVAPDSLVQGSMVSMWNRVRSSIDYGNHWIHSKINVGVNKFSITSFIWSEKKEEQLSLVFFVRCKSIETEKRKILSGGLERVLVHTSKIDLCLLLSKVHVQLKEPTNVEIIPLAGGEFFFNSDFILSIPFHLDCPLGIDFVMD